MSVSFAPVRYNHRPWFHSPPASIENRKLFRNAFLTTISTISKVEYQCFPPSHVFARRGKRIAVGGTVDVGVFGDANEGLCIRQETASIPVELSQERLNAITIVRRTPAKPTISHSFRFREAHAGCGVVPDSFVDSFTIKYTILLSICRPQLFYPFGLQLKSPAKA